MDLNMLVLAPGGLERTKAEFAALLRQADSDARDSHGGHVIDH